MIGGPPRLGWVLRYSYDWTDRNEEGSPAFEKERPVVIVLSVARTTRPQGATGPEQERWLVRVAPITHRPPAEPTRAVEIPRLTKERLGLDGECSWIVLDHANEFIWPGPDVRPVPGRDPATIYYGPLPPALFDTARRVLLGLLKARNLRCSVTGFTGQPL